MADDEFMRWFRRAVVAMEEGALWAAGALGSDDFGYRKCSACGCRLVSISQVTGTGKCRACGAAVPPAVDP